MVREQVRAEATRASLRGGEMAVLGRRDLEQAGVIRALGHLVMH
jgi:hypothetical protein